MEWLLLALLAPLVLAPVVLMFGYAGCSSFGDSPADPPLAPTSLIAERTGDQRITLRWTHPQATAKFRISRGESSGSLAPVPTLQDITGTQADDNGLPEGTTFFYQIVATNGTEVSSGFSSPESSATTRPLPPSELAATSTLNSIAITWKNNSSKATRFVLERIGVKVDLAETSYTDSAVTQGVPYEYSVRAFVDGVNKGVPGRVESPEARLTATSLFFKPVFPPSTGTPVPLTTDQSIPGVCLVQRIGSDRLENGGTQVRVTIRGSLTGPLTLSAVTLSHAVATGEAWDSAAPLVSLGTNVILPAGTTRVLGPVAFALDKTRALLIAFDVSSVPGQGNVRFGTVADPQTKTYFKLATQQAQVANRASDFQPANSVYLVEKIEAA